MMVRILSVLVRAYRLLLSPWLGSSCRFEPTCSMYALQSLERHGAAQGAYLSLKRIARCHPWCDGGLDPVPAARSAQENPLGWRTLLRSQHQKNSS